MQFANPHFHILRPFFEFLVYCEAAFFYYSAASSSTILTRMQRKKPKNPQCRGAQWGKMEILSIKCVVWEVAFQRF